MGQAGAAWAAEKIQQGAFPAARQSGRLLPGPTPIEPFSTSGIARLARNLIRARARRRRFFDASLFSDPAWDILLEVFAAEQEGRRVCISTAGLGGQIPLTTALRWINLLQQQGLLRREDDPLHGRRSLLFLTDKGSGAMRDYFRSCFE